MRPTILTIAGSDCSGGAGVQADLKTIEASGGYGATAITALTVQSTRGVSRVRPVSADLLAQQILAVMEDLPVAAVKSGMLGGPQAIVVIARALEGYPDRPYVLDPVLRSTSGRELLPASCVPLMRARLFPKATMVTPNVAEAEVLSGMRIRSVDDAESAGARILEDGPGAVLVKGGHLLSGAGTDVLVTCTGVTKIEGELIDTPHTHGTGCVYASAIATRLALGEEPETAARRAKAFVVESIRRGLPLGSGPGPVDPMHRVHVRAEGRPDVGRLHVITDTSLQTRFDHVRLAELAARGGADTVQFREKRGWTTARLVETAGEIADRLRGGPARLVVNDRVDVAAAASADGVHLGKHDLHPAEARRLAPGSMIVGATANSLEEALDVARLPVDYVGVGPVFGTTSKENPAPALGLDTLRRITGAVDRPVIAIGGITADRVPEVLDAGAHGVAVLSDVVCDRDPAGRVAAFRASLDRVLVGTPG